MRRKVRSERTETSSESAVGGGGPEVAEPPEVVKSPVVVQSPEVEEVLAHQQPRALHGEGNTSSHSADVGGVPFEFPTKDNHEAAATVHNPLDKPGGPHCEPNLEAPQHTGPFNQAGPTPGVALGKRPKGFRSPPSAGSTQGPLNRTCLGNSQHVSQQFDLNSPVQPHHSSTSASSEVPTTPLSERPEEERGRPRLVGHGVPQQSFVNGEQVEFSSGGGVSAVDKEVLATTQVGDVVGIHLEGFEQDTRDLIVGEAVHNVIQ
ncbi:hypothetical protein HanHA300_Chr08g0264281 [Helianthus annuus]|nr:hypothetical protein HanHA300_Chr08g0264281 [Helianthus annuus]KAJ0552098.1 hypothetical protein HanHA89_Chr08g0281101 [Helianthus annuus]